MKGASKGGKETKCRGGDVQRGDAKSVLVDGKCARTVCPVTNAKNPGACKRLASRTA